MTHTDTHTDRPATESLDLLTAIACAESAALDAHATYCADHGVSVPSDEALTVWHEAFEPRITAVTIMRLADEAMADHADILSAITVHTVETHLLRMERGIVSPGETASEVALVIGADLYAALLHAAHAVVTYSWWDDAQQSEIDRLGETGVITELAEMGIYAAPVARDYWAATY